MTNVFLVYQSIVRFISEFPNLFHRHSQDEYNVNCAYFLSILILILFLSLCSTIILCLFFNILSYVFGRLSVNEIFCRFNILPCICIMVVQLTFSHPSETLGLCFPLTGYQSIRSLCWFNILPCISIMVVQLTFSHPSGTLELCFPLTGYQSIRSLCRFNILPCILYNNWANDFFPSLCDSVFLSTLIKYL